MAELELYYNNKIIKNNDFLTPNETKEEPIIKYKYVPTKKYILIMYDPDAVKGTYIHWLIINIKGDNISNGKTILQYNGPAPPHGSGEHRYIFEIYEQNNIPNIENINKEGRIISIDTLHLLTFQTPIKFSFFLNYNLYTIFENYNFYYDNQPNHF